MIWSGQSRLSDRETKGQTDVHEPLCMDIGLTGESFVAPPYTDLQRPSLQEAAGYGIGSPPPRSPPPGDCPHGPLYRKTREIPAP